MTSQYKASIWLISCLADAYDNPYTLETDREFLDSYSEKSDCQLIRDFYREFDNLHNREKNEYNKSESADDDISTVTEIKRKYEELRNTKYPYAIDPFRNDSFYMDLFAAVRFVYSLEKTLDEIEYDGLTFERAETLRQDCCFFAINSSNVMIRIDKKLDWNKHYMLCNDVITMANNMCIIAKHYLQYCIHTKKKRR